MSRILHSVKPLAPPFLEADERIVEFSARNVLEIHNPKIKILLFLEAGALLRIDGREPMTIRTGDALIVPVRCRQVYSVLPGAERCVLRSFRLDFDPAVLPPLPAERAPGPTRITQAAQSDFHRYIGDAFCRIAHLPGCLDAPMEAILRGFHEEMQERRSGHRHRVSGLCYLLATELVRRLEALPEKEASGDFPRQMQLAGQARHFMAEHLAEPLTLDKIAWGLNRSATHLARAFKQATGQTVFEYLDTVRIERARTWLETTPLAAAEIARRTGFSSPTVFGRKFKRRTGYSPNEFRARMAAESETAESFIRPSE